MKISKDRKTALLFGATGLVGGHLLEFLLLNEAYKKVVTFSRRPIEIEHPKLEKHLFDFDNKKNYEDLRSGDDLFCCLGTTMRKAGSREAFYKVDYTYPFQIAESAVANGVNQFLLVTAVGADPDSLFFYNRVKGELELAVQKLPFWSTHVFRPSLLLGTRNENRWGEEMAGKFGSLLNRVTGGLLTKYRPIEADVVAKAMVNAAQELEPGFHLYPSSLLQELANKDLANLMKPK